MVVKRVFDLVVGGATTLVALPLIGVLALAIKIDSRGPVFFRQERMGRGGRVFRIYKLRSMHVDAEQLRYDLAEQNEYSGPMFKIKRRPAYHASGVHPAQVEPRRGAPDLQRAAWRDEPGGPAAALGRRSGPLPRLDQEAPRHHRRASPACGR